MEEFRRTLIDPDGKEYERLDIRKWREWVTQQTIERNKKLDNLIKALKEGGILE